MTYTESDTTVAEKRLKRGEIVDLPPANNESQNLMDKFMEGLMRMTKELMEKGETTLVAKVWKEKLEGTDGYMLYGYGFGQNKEVLIKGSAYCGTPWLFHLYINEEQNIEFEKAVGCVLGGSFDKVAREEAKKNFVVEELLRRLCEQDVTFAGKDSPQWSDKQERILPPDQSIEIFLHGWTGNPFVFRRAIQALIRGMIKSKGQWGGACDVVAKWNPSKRANIARAISTMGGEVGEKELSEGAKQKIIEMLASSKSPENRVFMSFGTMGSLGTTPKDTEITLEDIYQQPVDALLTFIRSLSAHTDINDELVLKRIMQRVNWWGHSMGGRVVVELTGNEQLQALYEKAKNYWARYHVMNGVIYGSKVTREVKAQVEMWLGMSQPSDHVTLHKGILGWLASSWVVNKMLGFRPIGRLAHSMRITDAVNASFQGELADKEVEWMHTFITSGTDPDMVANNNRLLKCMPFIIGDDETKNRLMKLVAEGRIDWWSGNDDGILTHEEMNLVAQLIGLTKLIKTRFHYPESTQFKDAWQLITMPIRGLLAGGPIQDDELPPIFEQIVQVPIDVDELLSSHDI